MKCVWYWGYTLAVSSFFLFVPLAYSQEDSMALNHRELGLHERPLVAFSHKRHAANIECLRCHHDYDAYSNNRGGEDKAQSCANCHSTDAKKRLPPLAEAFHAQCKGCHEKSEAKGKSGGPVMCGECHVRN